MNNDTLFIHLILPISGCDYGDSSAKLRNSAGIGLHKHAWVMYNRADTLISVILILVQCNATIEYRVLKRDEGNPYGV